MKARTRPRNPFRLAHLACLLPALAFLPAGCASMPAGPGMTAEVLSEPPGREVLFRGKAVGAAPLELAIADLDDAVDVSVKEEQPPLVERRIKVLGPDRVRIVLSASEQPSELARALGLARVVVFDYGERATFEVDKYDLKPELTPLLARQAEVLEEHFGAVDVYVCGHTDSTGEETYNELLSLRRAQAVADYLVEHGLGAERLHVQGLGQAYPLASNESAEGRGLNRRTEIVLPD